MPQADLIEKIECEAFDFPFSRPESDGTERWDKTTLIVTRIHAGGQIGLGYTYGDSSIVQLTRSLLLPALKHQPCLDIPTLLYVMLERVRNAGRTGMASMAIAAVDIALWDLKAKLLKVPLSLLLGRMRPSVPAYGSGGFTSLSIPELEKQLHGWLNQGLSRVKMKVGRDPHADLRRVRAARRTIGNEVELYVDANGAYDRKEALQFAEAFAELGVRWFEEPVSSDDLPGLRFIRDHAPAWIEITAGEYGYDPAYFLRMLEAEAVDVAQIDATRCLGITGFLKSAAVCEARGVPVSAHTAPSVHTHLCCAIPHLRHVEYFSDHAWVEGLAFDGAIRPSGGELAPDLTRPGLGLELKIQDIEYRQVA